MAARRRELASDRVTAENVIYEWLEYIEASFEQEMDKLLSEIDRRNARYARSAAERLRLKLHQSSGTGHHIFTVLAYLKKLAQAAGEKTFAPEEVTRSIALFPQADVDSQSLRKPPTIRRPHNPEPIRAVPVSVDIRKKSFRSLLPG